MTVRIKIDELLANGKFSVFPLFCSAAHNTPASCSMARLFIPWANAHIGAIHLRALPLRRLFFNPRLHSAKKLISELITL